MKIINARQAGVKGRLTPQRYWASEEGRRRKELRRLDGFAARRCDMTPRLVRRASSRTTCEDSDA